MPEINPEYVPTVAPGGLFTALTTDTSLDIRWLTAKDPAFYEILNRPMADITVRQLILAKAIDTLDVSLGHSALFPFIIQSRINSGSSEVDLPQGWLWDVHLSIPKKWENLRLAKVKRISGSNQDSDSFTGKLRLIFTATAQGSSSEVGLVYADYRIDSTLTYQIVRVSVVTTTEESVAISQSEAETVTGFIIFKTLDTTNAAVQSFLEAAAPPTDTDDSNSDGLFDDPAVYELVDSVSTDTSGSFSTATVSHGTGMLTSSAWNAIPSLDSDIQGWLNTFNYPFDADANRTSVDSIQIPLGMFREFNITAPAGDEATGDVSGLQYPVWITRIERVGATTSQLRFYFATYNVTDTDTGGTPSTEAVEFATLDLTTSMSVGDVVEIVPIADLQLKNDESDTANWQQHFGRGHVSLSALWDGTTVTDFFEQFALISDDPADTTYAKASTRISSYGVSRVSKYTPTIGQGQALLGSTSRLATPLPPSKDNRYVTESDQGIGDTVDLEVVTGISPNIAIERYGSKGSLCHRIVKLVVYADRIDDDDTTFYDNEILPRLSELLGRDPIFGDVWYDGTRFKTYNGSTWQG